VESEREGNEELRMEVWVFDDGWVGRWIKRSWDEEFGVVGSEYRKFFHLSLSPCESFRRTHST